MPIRLTVLGFIIAVISTMFPNNEVAGLIGIPALLLWVWAFIVAIRNSLKGKGHRTVRLLRTLAATMGIIIAYFAVRESFRFLAFMAAGGSGGLSYGLGPLDHVDIALILVSAVLLIWIPEVFFRLQLDRSGTGDAQRVLLGLITATSCAMTGICVFLLHFDGGPLRSVNAGALVVGIIGTVLLVAHPYRSLARVCWQRRITGVFSFRAMKQHWGNMVTELGEALNRAAERDIDIEASEPRDQTLPA